MPKVSIITASYNREKYLPQAINSVLGQSFQDWELIIIDDASQDKTAQIIKKYQRRDRRIKYLKNSKNKGLVKSLNIGLKIAKGKYIARLDDDDWWCDKHKLQKQIEFLEQNPKHALVGTFAIIVNDYGEKVKKLKLKSSDLKIRQAILVDNQFIHSSVLFRKSILKTVGNYHCSYVEDYDFFLRIGQKYKMANLKFYGICYRLTTESISHHKAIKMKLSTIFSMWKYRHYYPHFWQGFAQRIKDNISCYFSGKRKLEQKY